MRNQHLFRKVFIVALSIGLSFFLQAEITSAANGTSQTDEGVEVLTRGPIHEAFADVSVDETPSGAVITRPVPEPINEIPPEFRPEGEQITWIPGYWSWDEDQNDFIWVSGVWRDVPPGRQWIPGYWISVENDNQYISGYWTDTNQSRTEYLPPPPKPLAVGPSSPSTAPNFVWIEGSWIWSHNAYAWQTGYWHAPKPEMVWIPAHYVWTPRGFIFVMGYWDYQLSRRGLMFAPLYYPRPIYRNHGYFYTPSIVLDFDAIFLSLFIRNSHHYYFGDYYDPRYEKRGFRPWYSNRATRYGYDPYYRNYRSYRLRNDKNWEHNYHKQFQYRRDHIDARPPRVYRKQEKHNYKQSHNPAKQMIGRRLVDVVANKAQPVRFTHLKPDNKRESQRQEQSHKLKNIQIERRKFETAPYVEKRSLQQPMNNKKPERMKQTAPLIYSKPEKTDSYGKPPEKLHNNRRVNKQEQTRNQPQAQPKERKQSKQQDQTRNQPQVQPKERKQSKQQGQTRNQPQVVPQEGQELTPQVQTEERGKSKKWKN
ncbi:MAG: hypothetical protein ACI8ZB_002504 [Desulforhopalus sp.]|jgi:hypothetical protein